MSYLHIAKIHDRAAMKGRGHGLHIETFHGVTGRGDEGSVGGDRV